MTNRVKKFPLSQNDFDCSSSMPLSPPLASFEYSKSTQNDEQEEDNENRCVECNINMGDCNPRQYCGKTKCDRREEGVYKFIKRNKTK